MIQVGSPAPDFGLEGTDGAVKLSQNKGKWTVFFFYPLDFTFVCPTEVTEFSKRIDEFKKQNTVVWGASVDSVHSHKAWAKSLGGLQYPLLSDFNKEVGRQYGVLLEDKGHTLRATFIIDPEGILRFMQVNDNNVGRNVGEILRVLQALKTGELCQVEWKPGEKTLGKAK
ncbi:MAG: peroxiredoxin [Candidatus Micrarchaeota archaeon]